ncbi:MAG: CHAT domain-containing protein [Acidobacteriia bacterium]|nr:CHAT domain-containing protein [Terriglobia bacterium]
MNLPVSPERMEQFVTRLLRLRNPSSRRKFLEKDELLHHRAVVEHLYEEALKRAHVDLRQADRLASAAQWIAERLNDDIARAQCRRVMGHLRYFGGNYKRALVDYKAALRIFQRHHRELDVGRTLSGAMQTLIYLGRYDEALAWAQKARTIFRKHGDRARLARLEGNIGNILYRQDRFSEALRLYQQVLREFRRRGEKVDVAAALSNIAVCEISLNDFTRAEQIYQEARTYCEENRMPLLVAEADYNIAYLHYLRGEYTRSISMYQAAREHCERVGDVYHRALCDLDQSEMYLELNLSEEGSQLAEQAFLSFKKLGMGYEAAKAMTNLAIAASHRNQFSVALQSFMKARRLFLREQNHLWPALIDLYRALVLFRANRPSESELLAQSALKFFAKSGLSAKAVLCELLLARLYLQAGESRRALKMCRAALRRIKRIETPAQGYQAYFVLGQIQEARGDQKAAMQAYLEAHSRLENLRSQIRAEELKIAFLKDKLSVYESLVWMSLDSGRPGADPRGAFAYIEQAKSRSLADLIAFRAQSLPAPRTFHLHRVEQARRLREELNWYYHQIDLQGMLQEKRGRRGVEQLSRHARDVENRLLKTLSSLRSTDMEFSSLQDAGCVSLEDIRAQIPADTVLLEYYEARQTIYACLLSREHLEIVAVASISKVRDLFRLLQFQLSKYRLGPEYVRTFEELLHEATRAHLSELYQELLAPVRNKLHAAHLIVVPHSFLHYLPFHALFDGERYLVDDFTISYAPSASVYYLCCSKQTRPEDCSLILGIPDVQAPQILDEVQAVASTLPNPQLYLGEEANEQRLRGVGSTCRFLHIATHGLFRQDNPMFSAIRLGDSMLSLFDLYHLNLSSELVTLSGCATGSNVVVGGDELLGLVRGLLYAGAKAVLVSLWDVNDQSTADFMKSFYSHLPNCSNKSTAVQRAIQDLRQNYPHPYYWAPFVMIGDVISPEGTQKRDLPAG